MAVDVEVAQRVRSLRGPALGEGARELQRPAAAGQLAARRLHLRRSIQAQHTAELPGRMGGQSFGALDAHQGHQAEAQEHRGQAVVPVLQTTVELLSHLDEALPEQGGQRHQHARLGHRLGRGEPRQRFHQQPGRRQGALRRPRRRHTARTRGIRVASRARRARKRSRGALRPGTRPPGALLAHQAAVLEALANRLLGHPNLRGDLAVGQALGEEFLGAYQDMAFELARSAGAPPLDL